MNLTDFVRFSNDNLHQKNMKLDQVFTNVLQVKYFFRFNIKNNRNKILIILSLKRKLKLIILMIKQALKKH